MEYQVEKNEHFRHLLLYKFNQGSQLQRLPKTFVAVYAEDPIAEKTAQKLFPCFKQNDFDMSDTPRSGRHLVGYGGDCPL
jgi:hypothetical protein